MQSQSKEGENSSRQEYALVCPSSLCEYHRKMLIRGFLGLILFNVGPNYEIKVSIPMWTNGSDVVQVVRVTRLNPEIPNLSFDQVCAVMSATYELPLH